MQKHVQIGPSDLKCKTSYFLLLSLVIHGLVLLFLFSKNRHEAEMHTQIDIEMLVQNKQVISTGNLNTENQQSSHINSSKQKNSLIKEMLFNETSLFSYSHFKKNKDNNLGHAARESWAHSENYQGSEFQVYEGLSMDVIKLEKTLWKEVDQSVVDTPYLSEFNHAGRAFLRFEVDEQGHLVESSMHACGEDGVLRVLGARAIRKALANEHNEIKFPAKKAIFYAQFIWADYDSCRSLHGIYKNYLSFCHHAENKRKTFTSTEQAATYLNALKYGFDAIDEIKKYNREASHRQTDFDPFVELKKDPDWNLSCN